MGVPEKFDDSVRESASESLSQVREESKTKRSPEEPVPLIVPAALMPIMQDVLTAVSAGVGITLIREDAELTTQQAANYLNVSRPFLVNKLLEAGEIPFTRTGSHRRVKFSDLYAYQQRRAADIKPVLEELIQNAEELGAWD